MNKIRLRKILATGGASVVFYSLVTSTALALFIPKVTLAGMSFGVGRLELQISGHQVAQPDESSYTQNASFPGSDTLLPGGPVVKEDFWIRNKSTERQNLFLDGQLSGGNYDWDRLKNVIQARLRVYGGHEVTDWMSLEQWTLQAHALPVPMLGDGSRRRYEFEYRLLENYPTDPDGAGPLQAGSPVGNELVGKKTTNLNFIINGRPE